MKIAAVIAECNPFHEGHAYLIRKLKEEAGADYVLLLMSGDFVQRGVPAVADKRVRASMALREGADLVLSYPVRFATCAAPDFADAAVRILDGLSCIDILGFGTQDADLERLRNAAEAMEKYAVPEEGTAPDDGRGTFRLDAVGEAVRAGASYPAAVASADPFLSAVLSGTGNVLALEYLKTAGRIRSAMIPVAVPRCDVSASEIREKLEACRRLPAGQEWNGFVGEGAASYDIGSRIPEKAKRVLTADMAKGKGVCPDDLSMLVYDRLIRAKSPSELLRYLGMTESLANSLYRERFSAVSFTGLVSRLHTKDRTAAAVRRALLHVALGLKKKEIEEEMLYTQILGFREDAAPVLARISDSSRIPVLAKAAQAERVLGSAAHEVFLEEIHASELYAGLRAAGSGALPVSEYTRKIVKITE